MLDPCEVSNKEDEIVIIAMPQSVIQHSIKAMTSHLDPSEKITAARRLGNIEIFISARKRVAVLTCNPGKNLECIKAGFFRPIRGATSRVIRKYASCTIGEPGRVHLFILQGYNERGIS